MGPFIFTLVLVVILIVCGVGASLYLYTHGAIGDWRFRRSRRLVNANGETSTEDDSEDDASSV